MNLDVNAAVTLVSEGSTERHGIKAFIGGHSIAMTVTAMNEFLPIIRSIAGPLETARARRLLQCVTVVPDQPSVRARGLRPTRGISQNDIVILGTGDELGAITVTADSKAVRSASAQGVDFDVFLHVAVPLTGS